VVLTGVTVRWLAPSPRWRLSPAISAERTVALNLSGEL
jgi:hypothetical protein